MDLDRILRFAFPKPPKGARGLINYKRARLTPKRLINLHWSMAEFNRAATTVRSLPLKLVIEATNVCNLGCPGCLTGVGENGRVRSAVSLEAFQRVMDDLAETLFEVEFYNWGEPFLNKNIYAMIADANARGVATTISTNFSVPFDEEKAEQLVRSGLATLGVSIDGATQETYEQYRVGGDLETVLRNCQLVAEAKRRLGSASPHMIWIFHAFPHNKDDVGAVRRLGKKIGFDSVSVSRGWTVEGGDWDPEGKFKYWHRKATAPKPCWFLWQYAVVHNEGGVAPCCGTFYEEDDFGRLSLRSGSDGAKSFRDVWNSENFRLARGNFKKGARSSGGSVCEQCPVTQTFHDMHDHLDAGKPLENFVSRFTPDDGHRYFFRRRPTNRDTKKSLKPARTARAPDIADAN